MPWKALVLFVSMALLGVLTGLARGNLPKAVFQDFRQYVEYIALYLLVAQRVRSRRQYR